MRPQCYPLCLSAGATELTQTISGIGSLTPIETFDDEARYSFTKNINGQQFIFIVTFAKENGIWKIRTF
jgi:hypothetical protein